MGGVIEVEWPAVRVRALRLARRMTREEFAALVGVSDRQVATWETVDTAMHPRNARTLDAISGALSSAEADRFAVEEARLSRGDGRQRFTVPSSRRAEAMGVADTADEVAASQEVLDALAGPRLGDAALEVLDAQIRGLAAGYFARPFLGTARAAGGARRIVRALGTSTSSLGEQRHLAGLAGRLSVLLGMASLDLGAFDHADVHLQVALALAVEAEDVDLVALTRARQSNGALFRGRPAEAVRLAEAGQAAAPSALRRLHLSVLVARAHARLGDDAGADRALAQAAVLADQAALERPAPTSFDYDLAQHLHNLGTTYLWLGRGRDAETHAAGALELFDGRYPSTSNRESARLDLAFALLARGEVEEAARTGVRSVEARGLIVDLRVRELDAALAAHRRLAPVRELHELVGRRPRWGPGGGGSVVAEGLQ